MPEVRVQRLGCKGGKAVRVHRVGRRGESEGEGGRGKRERKVSFGAQKGPTSKESS